MNFQLLNTTLRAGTLAIGVGALAVPALAQTSPAGAGGESNFSSVQRSQQRDMPGAMRPRFRDYVIQQRRPSYIYSGQLVKGAGHPQDGVRCCRTAPAAAPYGRYSWADIQGIRLMVRMP